MTPRIDTMRREINHTIELLRLTEANLEDLHELAYRRHRSPREVKVRGGETDYGLDTHGSDDARDLLKEVSTAVYNLVRGHRKDGEFVPGVQTHLERMVGWLTAGKGGSRQDRRADATADEVVAALDARDRREARGEYTPARLVDQPVVMSRSEWQVECEALRSAVRKVTVPFLEEHQTCQYPHTDHRGQHPKLKRRFQMKLLTPREREAWSRATQSVSAEEDEKAS